MLAVLSLSIGAIFVSAAFAKLTALDRFVEVLRPIASFAAKPVAIATILIESLLGLGLLAGRSDWRQLAALTGVLFLVVATLGMSWRLALGHDSRCGCWGSLTERFEFAPYDASFWRPALFAFRNSLLIAGLLILKSHEMGESSSFAFKAGLVAPLSVLVSLIVAILKFRMRTRVRVIPEPWIPRKASPLGRIRIGVPTQPVRNPIPVTEQAVD